MKNSRFAFLKVSIIILVFVLFQNKSQGQISCPFTFDNQLPGCNIDILYEYLDGSCACPNGCGPFFLSAGSGPNVLSQPGCCNVYTIVDIVIYIDKIGGANVGVYMDDGCVYGNSIGSLTFCSTTFGATWTSSGVTIQ